MQRLMCFVLACCTLTAFVASPAMLPAQENHDKKEAAKDEHAKGGEAHDDHGAKGGGHDDHHDAPGEAGVATDPMNVRTDLAIYSAVVFLVLVAALSATAWKPIVASLEKREHDLHADFEAARSNRVASEALLAEHQKKLDQVQDEVRAIIAEARRDADHVKEEIVSAANREAEQSRKRAVADIEQARDAALNQLFDKMAESVTQATRQVIGRSLTGDDHDRLVRESLSDLTRNVN